MKAYLAIIVPVLNEADALPELKAQLDAFYKRGVEIIIVDGGSTDSTADLVLMSSFRLIVSEKGRARQMNAGARATNADKLLFLHADTQLPKTSDTLLTDALLNHHWGRFDVKIKGQHTLLPMIALMMNWRSRLTGIATGDQAIFMRRSAFEHIGGFPEQDLMEDIEMSQCLNRLGKPACLRDKVITSGRRWEQYGLWRTVFLMWRLRLAYWMGTNPDVLAERYR